MVEYTNSSTVAHQNPCRPIAGPPRNAPGVLPYPEQAVGKAKLTEWFRIRVLGALGLKGV